MITDRLTARVLGLLLFVLPLIISVSFFIFSKPETRSRPGFALIVLAPNVPLFALGAYLFRKARRLEQDED